MSEPHEHRETDPVTGEAGGSALSQPSEFDDIARRYEKDSVVQRAASEVLFDLLRIGLHEDVLDLGCATGHLTEHIGQMTEGRVLGVDPSPEMIAEAVANHGTDRVQFSVSAAAGLSAQAEFDVIFCNSAFQWFRNERQALESCYRALRTGGRMAIQAPGSAEYCPNFLAALEQVDGDSETSAWFAHFHSPWLFLDSAEEYKALFESVGFPVPFSRIDVTHTRNTPTEVMSVFDSGARRATWIRPTTTWNFRLITLMLSGVCSPRPSDRRQAGTAMSICS